MQVLKQILTRNNNTIIVQLHDINTKLKRRKRKRVGRGGKRGSYSGRGVKGQQSRSGSSAKSDFRGGDQPLWKLFPKRRGASKKVDVKHRKFSIKRTKPAVVNLGEIDAFFKDGDIITKKCLIKNGLISSTTGGIKILGNGSMSKPLIFKSLIISKSARDKILKAGGEIKE